jgi:hypothetical protein
MADMQLTTARRAPFSALASLLVLLVVAGCGGAGASATATPRATDGTAPSPSPSSATASPAATLPTTTETDWGTIWDTVPPDFPVPQGAEPLDVGEAVSVAWSTAGRPAEITAGMVTALEAAGWSIEGASDPYEDGSQVIDAVRGAPACRTQVTVAPRGDEILVMVRLAAACPWS